MKDKIFLACCSAWDAALPHCTAACKGPAAGYRQLVHQRNHAGGLWPEQRHPPGTLIWHHSDVMKQTGSAVFNNLALLFAMAQAIGMWLRKERGGRPVRCSGLYHYEYSHSP